MSYFESELQSRIRALSAHLVAARQENSRLQHLLDQALANEASPEDLKLRDRVAQLEAAMNYAKNEIEDAL